MSATSPNVGFGQASATFTIPNGFDGSAVSAVDLERNFAFARVSISDCSMIQASTTMTLQFGFGASDTMLNAFDNSTTAIWRSGNLPTSGGFTLMLPPELTMGVRRVKIVLSQNTSGSSATFTVYGFDGGVV